VEELVLFQILLTVYLVQVGPDKELHSHGVALTDVGGGVAALQEGLSPREVGVKTVAARMGKGLDGAGAAVKGLKDEGHLIDRHIVGVSAPDLALAVPQVIEGAAAQILVVDTALGRQFPEDVVKQLLD